MVFKTHLYKSYHILYLIVVLSNNNRRQYIVSGNTGFQTLLSVHFPNLSTGYTVGTNGTILKYKFNVGFKENPNEININHLYPNPSAGTLTIESEEPINSQQIEIYDIFGKRIQPIINQNNNVLNINLIGHSKGMYFIKIGTYSQKIIVE